MKQYKNLRELRQELGFYPSVVAKQLKICYRQFARIELGQGYLTDNRAKVLSDFYNVDIKVIQQIYERSHKKYED